MIITSIYILTYDEAQPILMKKKTDKMKVLFFDKALNNNKESVLTRSADFPASDGCVTVRHFLP